MDISLLILELLIIIIYLIRNQIIERIPDKYRSVYRNLIGGMRISIGKWYFTILVPILIIFVFYIGWVLYWVSFVNVFPKFPINDPLPIYILSYVIVGPIAEQILQSFYLSAVYSATKNMMVNFVFLIIVSVFFSLVHFNTGLSSMVLRFLLFMVYGMLYYLNDQNMLPSMVAHSSWNLFVITPLLY
jgi:hypothetical protein